MSSPLNQLADNLPNILLSIQDIKLRQDAQQALANHRNQLLTQTIRANDLKQEAQQATNIISAEQRLRAEKADMLKLEDDRPGGAVAVYGAPLVNSYFPGGIPKKTDTAKDAPEVKILGDRIKADLDILNSPDTFESDKKPIRARIRTATVNYKNLTGRDYPTGGTSLGEAAIPAPNVVETPVAPVAPSVSPTRTASVLGGLRGDVSTGLAAPVGTETPVAAPVPEGFQLLQNTAGEQIYWNPTTGEQRPVE